MNTTIPAAAEIDLARWVRPGDTLMWGQAGAEPLTLVRALAEQRQNFARTRVFLGVGHAGLLRAEHADAIDLLAYCGSGSNRQLADAGVLDIWPGRYSALPAAIRGGPLRIDVLLLQVSPPDAQGRHSLGLAQEYLLAALDSFMRGAQIDLGLAGASDPVEEVIGGCRIMTSEGVEDFLEGNILL